MSIFLAEICSQGESQTEYEEAIAGVISFIKEELKKGLVQGFLKVSIQGKEKHIPLRDPFLTFALFQSELRKLL